MMTVVLDGWVQSGASAGGTFRAALAIPAHPRDRYCPCFVRSCPSVAWLPGFILNLNLRRAKKHEAVLWMEPLVFPPGAGGGSALRRRELCRRGPGCQSERPRPRCLPGAPPLLPPAPLRLWITTLSFSFRAPIHNRSEKLFATACAQRPAAKRLVCCVGSCGANHCIFRRGSELCALRPNDSDVRGRTLDRRARPPCVLQCP